MTLPLEPSDRSGANSSPGQRLLSQVFGTGLIAIEDWEALPAAVQGELAQQTDRRVLLARLVALQVLTEYQAIRLQAGTSFGLVLGNYRVLERLGAGGMATVYRGEHLRLRRPVAIKVLSLPPQGEDGSILLRRFHAEMRAVGTLDHPHIVSAFDAGEAVSPDPNDPVLHYFVMAHVQGQNLEQLVEQEGPLPVSRACDLISQIAGALDEAHRHHLIHRDIKPANILVTPAHQAKLLDFGLARHFGNRMTEAGMTLGTVDYLAPEQARDASTVDHRVDLFSLGATLYFALTGAVPYPSTGNLMRDLVLRQTQSAPSILDKRPGVPPALAQVVQALLAIDPGQRPPSAQAVQRALFPFLQHTAEPAFPVAASPTPRTGAFPRVVPTGAEKLPVLLVDDEAACRGFCRRLLEPLGLVCEEAACCLDALAMLHQKSYGLVLLDIDLPDGDGVSVLRQLREKPPAVAPKVIMLSGRVTPDELSVLLAAGADDFLGKPVSAVQLQSRAQAALRLRDAEERLVRVNRQLVAANAALEQYVNERDTRLLQMRDALVMTVSTLVARGTTETAAHLTRMQHYVRLLAEMAAQVPAFAADVNAEYVQMLERCVPLHDIGNVLLPDHVLFKPGPLDASERLILQTHTTAGAEALQEVFEQHGLAVGFLQMAIDIARHHHERYDGTGYPDKLAGPRIPLAARIVTVCDVYDALRSRRPYRPAFSHNTALQIMSQAGAAQFDPGLLNLFLRAGDQFDRIWGRFRD